MWVQNNKIEKAKGQGHKKNQRKEYIYYFRFTILMSI